MQLSNGNFKLSAFNSSQSPLIATEDSILFVGIPNLNFKKYTQKRGDNISKMH